MIVTGTEIRQAYEVWSEFFITDEEWRNWLDPVERPEDVLRYVRGSYDNYECSEAVARKIKLLCSPNGYALCKAMVAQQDD